MNRPMTVLVLLALLASTACFSLPSSEEAGISYATTPIDWPENAPCLNEETPALAKEIIIADGPGLTSLDLTMFPYTRIRRPMWPIDP